MVSWSAVLALVATSPSAASARVHPVAYITALRFVVYRFCVAAAAPFAPAIAATLTHDDWAVRREALHALGQMGPTAAAYAAPIAGRLVDACWPVRRVALHALAQTGTLAPEHIATALGDAHWSVRCEALRAMARAWPVAADPVHAAATYLTDAEYVSALHGAEKMQLAAPMFSYSYWMSGPG